MSQSRFECMPIWERFSPETRRKMVKAFKRTKAEAAAEPFDRPYKPNVMAVIKGHRVANLCPLAYAIVKEGLVPDNMSVGAFPNMPGGSDVARFLMKLPSHFSGLTDEQRLEFETISSQATEFFGPWDSRSIHDLAAAACVKPVKKVADAA